MTFDAMRRHQKKVMVPLAVIVTVTMVFFGAFLGGLSNIMRGGTEISTETELRRLGQDLQSAGFIRTPPRDYFRRQTEREVRSIENERERGREHGRRMRAKVNAWYREMAARVHHLPLACAEDLGVEVSDDELTERIRGTAATWGIQPFDPAAYREELSARALAAPRFEEILNGQLAVYKTERLLNMTSGPSEAELYGYYCRAMEKVRVQYFQRLLAEFVPRVEEHSRKEAAEAAGKKTEEPKEKAGPGKKAGEEKEGKEAAEKKAPGDKKGDKKKEPERKGVIEEDVKKSYQQMKKILDRDFERNGKKRYSQHYPDSVPEYFSVAKAEVEFLVALRKDFRRGLKVTDEEIEKHYKDNPKEFEEKPKEGGAPRVKQLDRGLKKEIRKKLLETKAGDAAMEALRKVVEEYNKVEPAEREKLKLAELAGKNKLLRRGAGPGTLEELEKVKYLDAQLSQVYRVFEESRREALGGKLTEPWPLTGDEGYAALRLVEFQPVRLLGYEEARAGVRQRLVLKKAGDLAKEAITEDLKLLEAGKLAAARVRESVLLDPESEASRQVVDLAVGEAGKPFRYWEHIEPKARAREEEAKKEKKGRKTVAETLPKGWRVVILVERRGPSMEEFREDRFWREFKWAPSGIFAQYRGSPDVTWRKRFLNGWYEEKYFRLSAGTQ